ncbi:MAG: DUF1932 domain-containing protein, partial [Acidimicrobiales bacterium]
MSETNAVDPDRPFADPHRQGVALLHPGAMGASLGAALVRASQTVWWLPEGRGDATAARAAAAGLQPAGSWSQLLAACDLVISICPPDAATAVAGSFAAAAQACSRERPGWTYVDANAISPSRAQQVAAVVEAVGARFVDGDVVGPPVGSGRTCLYLSGPHAEEVAARFTANGGDTETHDRGYSRGHTEGYVGRPEVRVLGDDPTAASALKMLYAGWTKASGALLLALWAAAERAGVAPALAAEWQVSQPDLPGRLEQAVSRSVPKAWRFAGEMDEIAHTLAELGLPAGFHRAAAELFGGLTSFKDGPPPFMVEVLACLAGSWP